MLLQKKFSCKKVARTSNRVAECHGYDGYIRVKMFAGWGKKSGTTCDLAKSSIFGKSYATYALFTCNNLPLSTFSLQN